MESPVDPLLNAFGQATQLATLLREQYEAFTRVGFTDRQAWDLTQTVWQLMCTKALMQGDPS